MIRRAALELLVAVMLAGLACGAYALAMLAVCGRVRW